MTTECSSPMKTVKSAKKKALKEVVLTNPDEMLPSIAVKSKALDAVAELKKVLGSEFAVLNKQVLRKSSDLALEKFESDSTSGFLEHHLSPT